MKYASVVLGAQQPSVVPHGLTGTWLDEFVQIGLPLIAFAILYFWSKRKEKAKRAGAARDEAPRNN